MDTIFDVRSLSALRRHLGLQHVPEEILEDLMTDPKRAAGWDRMIKRILGFEAGPERQFAPAPSPATNTAPAPVHARAPASAAAPMPVPVHVAYPVPPVEDDSANKQMKKLARDWIVTALSAPQSMLQIAVQFRHIVEGFWPFNDPARMNVPHPEFMDIIAEEMQTILVKCEAPTQGYPCVAAQPHSLPHFCNFMLLLGHFVAEFTALPFDVPEFLFHIAFRACNLCLKSPLQLPMAQALLRVWKTIGCELETRLGDFPELVDAVRDAVIYGSRALGARADPKELLVEALELRCRGWRPPPPPGPAPSAAGKGSGEGAGGTEGEGGVGGGSALADALARATVRRAAVEALGAAGDWAPPPPPPQHQRPQPTPLLQQLIQPPAGHPRAPRQHYPF
ncbi:hypothetical protein R5R35_010022 [Gryllus longicercus]|uniref:Uncharacterized protein n=1 Tax=Gryllus longicercus TaxID=2509291 RepID=A0AAN9ZCK4_9ORTH